MRVLLAFALLALAVLAPTVSAQTNRLTAGETVLMVLAGTAAEVGVLAVAGESPGMLVYAMPVAAGVAAYGMGQALGNQSRLAPTMLGAGLGALPGIALVAAAGTTLEASTGEDDLDLIGGDTVLLLVTGAVAYLLIPPIAATAGFGRGRSAAAPVVLTGPGGERAAGLALRLSL